MVHSFIPRRSLFIISFHFYVFLFCLGDIYSNRREKKTASFFQPSCIFLVFALSCIPFTIFPLISLVSGIFFFGFWEASFIWWDGLHYMSVKHKSKREHHCPDSHNTTRTNQPPEPSRVINQLILSLHSTALIIYPPANVPHLRNLPRTAEIYPA